VQLRSPSAATKRRFESDSNVIDASDLHLEKQDLQNNSTDVGMISDVKSLLENANALIRCNFEFDSNVIDVSDVQLEKHDRFTTEIDDEIHAR
jgi:hypothetical protein